MKEIQSLREFWPFYLSQHSHRSTQILHAIGTVLGLGISIRALTLGHYSLIPLGLIPGYGLAWLSHFYIEKNKPATFTYPLWSFICDFIMLALLIFNPKKLVQRRVK